MNDYKVTLRHGTLPPLKEIPRTTSIKSRIGDETLSVLSK
jgi:hypothetical protein